MFKKALVYGIPVFVILLAVLFFIKIDIEASESEVINSDKETVMSHVIDLKRFHTWDPRVKTDSLLSTKFEGEPGVGMKSITMYNDSVFLNKYEILKIENDTVLLDLEIQNNHHQQFVFVFKEEGSRTLVNWSIGFEAILFAKIVDVEGQLKTSFKQGFRALTQVLEK